MQQPPRRHPWPDDDKKHDCTLSHFVICKANVIVSGAQLINVPNNVIHGSMVQLKTPMPGPKSILGRYSAYWPLRIGNIANWRHEYDLDITDLSLLRQPTAEKKIMLYRVWYQLWHRAWYRAWYIYTYGKPFELESLSWEMCRQCRALLKLEPCLHQPLLGLIEKILNHLSALQKAWCHAGLYTREAQSADTPPSACLP